MKDVFKLDIEEEIKMNIEEQKIQINVRSRSQSPDNEYKADTDLRTVRINTHHPKPESDDTKEAI